MSSTGDELLPLLGKPLDDSLVGDLLTRLDVPWMPTTGPGKRNDWIAKGNLELGFEDFAWFHALDASPPGAAPVLQQLCFFAPGAQTAQVVAPGFGVEFDWNRAQVRRWLSPRAQATRFAKRDAFDIGPLTVAIAFDEASSIIDSMLVLAARATRRPKADPPLGFAELAACFGREWYDAMLRSRLYALTDDDAALRQIKKHGSCNLIREAAVRLLYQRKERTWTLAGCEIYRDRVRDACTWTGEMPFGMSFHDLPDVVSAKLGRKPEREQTTDLESTMIWSLGEQRVVVTFDTIINLVSSITVGVASYWER